MTLLPYSGNVDTAKVLPLTAGLRIPALALAACFGLLPASLLPGLAPAAACILGGLGASFLAWRAHVLIGGYTGDVLGAVEQGYEIAFLLGVAACA